jgi:hypothetical protein
MRPHRVHTMPWLRPLGRRVLPNWLAITIGRHIYAWRQMTPEELAHELAHVRQWQRHGWRFPIAYVTDSIRARRSGKRWYHDNRFEVEARDEAKRGPRPD